MAIEGVFIVEGDKLVATFDDEGNGPEWYIEIAEFGFEVVSDNFVVEYYEEGDAIIGNIAAIMDNNDPIVDNSGNNDSIEYPHLNRVRILDFTGTTNYSLEKLAYRLGEYIHEKLVHKSEEEYIFLFGRIKSLIERFDEIMATIEI